MDAVSGTSFPLVAFLHLSDLQAYSPQAFKLLLLPQSPHGCGVI
jgi:hypothetical protein